MYLLLGGFLISITQASYLTNFDLSTVSIIKTIVLYFFVNVKPGIPVVPPAMSLSRPIMNFQLTISMNLSSFCEVLFLELKFILIMFSGKTIKASHLNHLAWRTQLHQNHPTELQIISIKYSINSSTLDTSSKQKYNSISLSY